MREGLIYFKAQINLKECFFYTFGNTLLVWVARNSITVDNSDLF